MKRISFLSMILLMNLQVSAQFKNMLRRESNGPNSISTLTEPQISIQNTHLLPFFGEINRTPEQATEDEAFVATCKKNFKNKQEASEFFAARAWEYLGEGHADTAMYRFNLAWLLDKGNVEPYWGLGVIAYQHDNHKDAIRFMEKGRQINPSNVTLMVDLATIRIKCFMKDANSEHLKKANELLEKAVKIAPDFAEAYQKWSLAAFQEGKFDKAWAYFHKSFILEPDSIDQNFLFELIGKQADPKGVFKKQ